MTMSTFVLTIALALLAGMCAAPAAAFELHGHRGARGLAPENTLAGFARAAQVGVDSVELDVYLSADGVLLVHHDPAPHRDIARDASGQWLASPGPLLHSLSAAQARAYDIGRLRPGSNLANEFPDQKPVDGEHIPTLREVFAWIKDAGPSAEHLHVNIEIKMDPRAPQQTGSADDVARAVLAAVDAAGMRQRVLVQGFNWTPVRAVQRLAADVATGCLSIQQGRSNNLFDGSWTDGLNLADHGASAPRLVKAAGCSHWTPNFRDIDAARIQEAHTLGLKVVPWTVDDPADMQRLIAWGVDGLITDYPDRARTVMQAAGLPLPPGVATPPVGK